MSDVPIADYALLSDCRSAALVSRAGQPRWLRRLAVFSEIRWASGLCPTAGRAGGTLVHTCGWRHRGEPPLS